MRPAITHAAPPPPRRRTRGLLGTVIASSILVVSAAGPISAAPGTRTTPWSKGPTRTQTTRHIASAREAARLAVGNPRNVATKPRPLRSVKIASQAATGSARLPKQPTSVAPAPRIVSGPDVEVLQQFTGLSQSEGGGFSPPNPWVAVNTSYVVQSVDAMVRISNRAGVEISSVPTWTLFAQPRFIANVRSRISRMPAR